MRDQLLNALVALLLFLVAFLVLTFPWKAKAQDWLPRHAQGHGEYKDWASKKTNNCCNNEDCHYLAADEYRETVTGTELRASGK